MAHLERLHPGAAPVGENGPYADEAVHFHHDPSMAFSVRDVVEVAQHGEPPRFDITTSFLGLTGASGPLPTYLAEEVALEEDGAQRAFLDLFHHRLLSLLYRGLRRLALEGEHSAALDDPWSQRLLALSGWDSIGRTLDAPLPAREILRLSPLLAAGHRSAWALEAALQAVLADDLGGGRIWIEEFTGSWVKLEEDQQWQLGKANTRLGKQSVVGRRCLDRATGFCVHVGPVAQGTWSALLPGGALRQKLDAVVSLFQVDPLEHSVEVSLHQEEVPRLRLAARGGSRLGRDAWLGRVGEVKRVKFSSGSTGPAQSSATR